MSDKIPFGVKFARGVNFAFMALNVVAVLIWVVITIPMVIKHAEASGINANETVLAVIFVFAIVFTCVPAILLWRLNVQLKKLAPLARIIQIVPSFFYILFFPLGTVLGITLFYFMLFDRKTKEAFSEEPSGGIPVGDSAPRNNEDHKA